MLSDTVAALDVPELFSVAAKRFSSWLVINRSREPTQCVSLLDPVHTYIRSTPYCLCHTMGLFHLPFTFFLSKSIPFILRSRPYFYIPPHSLFFSYLPSLSCTYCESDIIHTSYSWTLSPRELKAWIARLIRTPTVLCLSHVIMRSLSQSSTIENDDPSAIGRSFSEEVQDLMMSSDGEGPLPTFPPPHVAARFYQTRNNRRKSSAASSRRNSISSHHSSRSTRSAHGGPQSSHVAQHLRRASILETRRARLADKAAHAEKVRLRAAMAKAAPRLSTLSEERAAAAKQARERYLAQVAANCAEEVKRAKRVAEDTREKKAAEHLKLKEDMEEKLAEAERRRALYQQNIRRPRTISVPAVDERKVVRKPLKDDDAARVIQKAWRNRQRRKVIYDFMKLELTVENIQNTGFEDAGQLLSREDVLTCTSKLLKLCGLQDSDGGGNGERIAVRTFLSTFLILGHPAHVFDQVGVQERDLVEKAENLLLLFGGIVAASPGGSRFSPLASQLIVLGEAYSSFQTAFAAWKDHDSSVLVQTMLAQFLELDAIWQTVKDDTNGDVAADYREGIRKNQVQILVGLKKLAGPEIALKMIRDALRRTRNISFRKNAGKDVRPRAALNGTDPPSSTAQRTPQPPGIASAEPRTQIQAGEARSGKPQSMIPDNRVILHELAVNKEYRIDTEARTEERNAVMKATVEKIRETMNSGIGDVWIVVIAELIRQKLLALIPAGTSLHTLISERLDPDLIASQVKFGSFSYHEFFSFMNTVLPKLCAPARDEEVKALAADPSEDPVERLAKLDYVIDLLSLDNANYTLQKHAPFLIKEASSYEQKIFAKEIGDRPLSKTLQWWTRSKTKLQEEASRRPASNANRVSSVKIYLQGITDLAIGISPLEASDTPETLELDLNRFNRTRLSVLRMITISTILVTAKNFLRRDVRSQWKVEAQRMWDLPYDGSQSFLSIIDSRHAMPASTKAQLGSTIERVLTDAKSRQITDPVSKVLLKKVKAHIFTRLSASSAEERIRATTTSSQVLASGGMSEFVEQVGSLIGELTRVGEVDRASHGKWYDNISIQLASSTA